MNFTCGVLYNDSEFADLRGWTGHLDTPDASVERGPCATPGEVVDQFYKWAKGRGHGLTINVWIVGGEP